MERLVQNPNQPIKPAPNSNQPEITGDMVFNEIEETKYNFDKQTLKDEQQKKQGNSSYFPDIDALINPDVSTSQVRQQSVNQERQAMIDEGDALKSQWLENSPEGQEIIRKREENKKLMDELDEPTKMDKIGKTLTEGGKKMIDYYIKYRPEAIIVNQALLTTGKFVERTYNTSLEVVSSGLDKIKEVSEKINVEVPLPNSESVRDLKVDEGALTNNIGRGKVEDIASEFLLFAGSFYAGGAALGLFKKVKNVKQGLAALSKATGLDFAIGFVLNKAGDENIAEFLNKYPYIANPIFEALETGEDDSILERKLKHGFADAGFGLGLTALLLPVAMGLKQAMQIRGSRDFEVMKEMLEKNNIKNENDVLDKVSFKPEEEPVPPIRSDEPIEEPVPAIRSDELIEEPVSKETVPAIRSDKLIEEPVSNIKNTGIDKNVDVIDLPVDMDKITDQQLTNMNLAMDGINIELKNAQKPNLRKNLTIDMRYGILINKQKHELNKIKEAINTPLQKKKFETLQKKIEQAENELKVFNPLSGKSDEFRNDAYSIETGDVFINDYIGGKKLDWQDMKKIYQKYGVKNTSDQIKIYRIMDWKKQYSKLIKDFTERFSPRYEGFIKYLDLHHNPFFDEEFYVPIKSFFHNFKLNQRFNLEDKILHTRDLPTPIERFVESIFSSKIKDKKLYNIPLKRSHFFDRLRFLKLDNRLELLKDAKRKIGKGPDTVKSKNIFDLINNERGFIKPDMFSFIFNFIKNKIKNQKFVSKNEFNIYKATNAIEEEQLRLSKEFTIHDTVKSLDELQEKYPNISEIIKNRPQQNQNPLNLTEKFITEKQMFDPFFGSPKQSLLDRASNKLIGTPEDLMKSFDTRAKDTQTARALQTFPIQIKRNAGKQKTYDEFKQKYDVLFKTIDDWISTHPFYSDVRSVTSIFLNDIKNLVYQFHFELDSNISLITASQKIINVLNHRLTRDFKNLEEALRSLSESILVAFDYFGKNKYGGQNFQFIAQNINDPSIKKSLKSDRNDFKNLDELFEKTFVTAVDEDGSALGIKVNTSPEASAFLKDTKQGYLLYTLNTIQNIERAKLEGNIPEVARLDKKLNDILNSWERAEILFNLEDQASGKMLKDKDLNKIPNTNELLVGEQKKIIDYNYAKHIMSDEKRSLSSRVSRLTDAYDRGQIKLKATNIAGVIEVTHEKLTAMQKVKKVLDLTETFLVTNVLSAISTKMLVAKGFLSMNALAPMRYLVSDVFFDPLVRRYRGVPQIKENKFWNWAFTVQQELKEGSKDAGAYFFGRKHISEIRYGGRSGGSGDVLMKDVGFWDRIKESLLIRKSKKLGISYHEVKETLRGFDYLADKVFLLLDQVHGTRALKMFDNLQHQLHLSNEVRKKIISKANYQNYQKKKDKLKVLSKEELKEFADAEYLRFMDDLRLGQTDNLDTQLLAEASDEVNKMNFMSGNVSVAGTDKFNVGSVIRSISDGIRHWDIPGSKLLTMFSHIISNIADFSMNYTPFLAYMNPDVRRAWNVGESTEILSKQTIGLGIGLLGYSAYNQSGMFQDKTIFVPKNKKERLTHFQTSGLNVFGGVLTWRDKKGNLKHYMLNDEDPFTFLFLQSQRFFRIVEDIEDWSDASEIATALKETIIHAMINNTPHQIAEKYKLMTGLFNEDVRPESYKYQTGKLIKNLLYAGIIKEADKALMGGVREVENIVQFEDEMQEDYSIFESKPLNIKFDRLLRKAVPFWGSEEDIGVPQTTAFGDDITIPYNNPRIPISPISMNDYYTAMKDVNFFEGFSIWGKVVRKKLRIADEPLTNALSELQLSRYGGEFSEKHPIKLEADYRFKFSDVLSQDAFNQLILRGDHIDSLRNKAMMREGVLNEIYEQSPNFVINDVGVRDIKRLVGGNKVVMIGPERKSSITGQALINNFLRIYNKRLRDNNVNVGREDILVFANPDKAKSWAVTFDRYGNDMRSALNKLVFNSQKEKIEKIFNERIKGLVNDLTYEEKERELNGILVKHYKPIGTKSARSIGKKGLIKIEEDAKYLRDSILLDHTESPKHKEHKKSDLRSYVNTIASNYTSFAKWSYLQNVVLKDKNFSGKVLKSTKELRNKKLGKDPRYDIENDKGMSRLTPIMYER